MKILKFFSKFMTNHSSVAYQVAVIAVPKGKDFYALERELSRKFKFSPFFNPVDDHVIDEIEAEFKIELHSLIDGNDIYISDEHSPNEHAFVEQGINYEYQDIADYFDSWLDRGQQFLDQLEKQGIKIIYLNQGTD